MMSLACKKKQLGEEVGRDQSELYQPYGFSLSQPTELCRQALAWPDLWKEFLAGPDEQGRFIAYVGGSWT